MLKIVVLAALLGLALAIKPIPHTSAAVPTPSWPPRFDASVMINVAGQQPTFVRWFFDALSLKSRFDGISEWQGENYFTTRITDFKAETETILVFQLDLAECYIIDGLNVTVPRPNFSQFQYIGQAVVGYQSCYHWYYTNSNGTAQYFESTTSGDPVRFDYYDAIKGEAASFLYMEFEEQSGPLDFSLFQIPNELQGTCTTIGRRR